MQKEAKENTKHNRSGYFFDGENSYFYLISKEKHLGIHKFIFKDNEIYHDTNDTSQKVDEEILVMTVKKFINDYHQRVLKYATALEKYEKIYTNKKDYNKFIQKHSILKYEIRKLQNRIYSIHDAIIACISDRPYLKDKLKNYANEAGIYRAAAAEYASRIEDIYQYVQGIKNDKINKNIYLLTILSAIFLPLNLITGFFGMNTTGLYLGELKNGTNIVSTIIILTFLLFVISWRWLERKKN